MRIDEKHIHQMPGQAVRSTIKITHVMEDGSKKEEEFDAKCAMIFGKLQKDDRTFVASAGSLGEIIQLMRHIPEMLVAAMEVLEDVLDDMVEKKEKHVCVCPEHRH